jgi:hypothetical protein
VLPFYRWELNWIAPSYDVQALTVDRSEPQPMFSVVASSEGKLLQCQVLVMHGIQHVVFVLLVPLAWPSLDWKRRLIGLAFSAPILFIVEFADIPWAIVGGLDLGRADFAMSTASAATVWMEILNTGGRLALGLAGGMLACIFARFYVFGRAEGNIAQPRKFKSNTRSPKHKKRDGA